MRKAAAKLTFIILTFNVTFFNKSHGDIKRRCIIYNQTTEPKVNVHLCWISLFSKSSWIKSSTRGLSHELGVNGEKTLMETGILLIKMDIAHFTFVNLDILTV